MAKNFDISEVIWIEKNKVKYHICPDCKDHEQGEPSEYYDCKNLIINNGRVIGQCMCYSLAHGKRGD